MLPRECDNDDCDYETGVDDSGKPRAWWVHVAPCEGPVAFRAPDEVHPESFLAFLMGLPVE